MSEWMKEGRKEGRNAYINACITSYVYMHALHSRPMSAVPLSRSQAQWMDRLRN